MSFSVHKSLLPSGLQIVTVETPHLHSVMCAVYVRVGSRHESSATNGVSHLLEHLFFRGSARWPDSVRMNAAVEAQGGNLNAVTMRDSSCFYTPTHVDGLEVSLEILGDMLTRPRLAELATEKRIILEEMLDEVDERGRDIDVDNLCKRALYGEHPLAMKIAGTPDSVKALTLADVKRHYARAYGAGNLVVSVAGPISHRRVVAATKKAFRHVREGQRLAEAPPPIHEPAPPKLCFVDLDEPQVEFRLCFPTVAEDHPDASGLNLLRRVLDDGLSSRLPYNIVEKRGLAYSVGAMIETFHDAGTFEIDGACAPENIADVYAESLRTLATLRRGQITREELERARTRFSMHLDFLQDAPGELCGWFGGVELYRPAETFAQKKAELNAVRLADLKALAQKYLRADRVLAVVVGPKSVKKSVRRVLDRADRLLG
ncbi:MAG: pitrilysin family protein [Myxococcaceae bacterium]